MSKPTKKTVILTPSSIADRQKILCNLKDIKNNASHLMVASRSLGNLTLFLKPMMDQWIHGLSSLVLSFRNIHRYQCWQNKLWE